MLFRNWTLRLTRRVLTVLGDSYFAILVYTATPNATGRVRQRQNGTESFDDVVVFEYVSEARAGGDVVAGTDLYFNAANYRPYMEISADVTVPRVLDVWDSGTHIISAPEQVDFRDNITATVFPGTRRAQIAVQDESIAAAVSRSREIVSPMERGVLYATVTNGGSGYTGVPPVAFAGGGGSGATGIAVVEAGEVRRVLLTNRGTLYVTAPTITISGGGGSGATATAHIGQYSGITQDFTDVDDESRLATSAFNLSRGLVSRRRGQALLRELSTLRV